MDGKKIVVNTFFAVISVLLCYQLVALIKQDREIKGLLGYVVEEKTELSHTESESEEEAFESFVDVEELNRRARSFVPKIGKVGGEMNYAASVGPKTFNLILNREGSTSNIIRRLYDNLIYKNSITHEYEPCIAVKWYPVSEDKLTWNFEMRRNVTFFDGHPLTADDVVFSYNDLLNNKDIDVGHKNFFIFREFDPKTGKTIEREMEVYKIDDYTVQLKFPFLQYNMLDKATAMIYPKHILKKYVENGTFNTVWDVSTDPRKIIGSGPWMLWEYKPGERAVLKRNPNWWKKDAAGQSLPYLDKVMFNIIPSQETQLLRFKAGEIDVLEITGEQFPMLKPLEKEKGFRIFGTGPTTIVRHIEFNQNGGHDKRTGKPFVEPYKLKWFRNRTFRRAIAHCIDKKTWIENFMNGFGEPLWSPVSPAGVEFYYPNVTKYEFDLERAEELLDEIGYIDRNGDGIREDPDGHNIEFTILMATQDEKRLRPGHMLVSDLRKVGVKATINILQFNTWIDKMDKTYDWECSFGGFYADIEPGYAYGIFTTWEPERGWKPLKFPENAPEPWEIKMNELFATYFKEFDREKRKQIGYEIQKIASEEIPLIYTVVGDRIFAIQDKYENVNPYNGLETNIWETMEYVYIKD